MRNYAGDRIRGSLEEKTMGFFCAAGLIACVKAPIKATRGGKHKKRTRMPQNRGNVGSRASWRARVTIRDPLSPPADSSTLLSKSSRIVDPRQRYSFVFACAQLRLSTIILVRWRSIGKGKAFPRFLIISFRGRGRCFYIFVIVARCRQRLSRHPSAICYRIALCFGRYNGWLS